MTKQQLLELARYEETSLIKYLDDKHLHSVPWQSYLLGARVQHERDMKLIEALIDSRERLREALKGINHDNMDAAGPAYGAMALARKALAADDQQLAKLKGE